MARSRRWLARSILGALVLAAGVFALVSWADRRRALDALPAGAGCAIEAVGVADLAERLEGTRFSAAFARSSARALFESSAFVAALDDARAAVGQATGLTPARRHLLDLVGVESAVAWYPVDTPAGTARLGAAPWVAAGRLSWRAWGLASALRLSLALGLGGSEVSREEAAGTTLVTLGAGAEATHVFLVGRLLVAGDERDLVRRAAGVVAGRERPLAQDEGWKRVFAPLPRPGALRLWVRGDLLPASTVKEGTAGAAPVRAAGAVLSAGPPVVVDIFVDAPGARRPAASSPPPALALAGETPLAFFSSGHALPPALAALLQRRAAQVVRARGAQGAPALPETANGYSVALTSAGEGLFPLPEGLLAVRMRDEAAARDALGLLFPTGARSGATRWGTALTTRESLPLAGETELWGVAAGNRLVLATRRTLLDALEQERPGEADPAAFVPGAAFAFDTVGTVSPARLLPFLQRYAAPLNGLARARRPDLPGVADDLALLAAVRSLAVTAGTSAHGTLARVTADVRDLPAVAVPPTP